jgi:hypothetical protein
MNRVIKEVAKFFMSGILMCGLLLSLPFSSFAYNGENHIMEAETGKSLNGAYKVADGSASGKYLVSLTKAGEEGKNSSLHRRKNNR